MEKYEFIKKSVFATPMSKGAYNELNNIFAVIPDDYFIKGYFIRLTEEYFLWISEEIFNECFKHIPIQNEGI